MKIGLLVFFACALVGCSQQHDAQYFLTHPLTLRDLLIQCHTGTNVSPAVCKSADQAYEELSNLAQLMVANPEKFGQKIIALETQLAALNKKIQILKLQLQKNHQPSNKQIERLQKQSQQLKKRIALMLSVAAEAEGM